MPQMDPVKATALQKEKWDQCSVLYDQEVIGKGATDQAAVEMLSALKEHVELPAGSRLLDVASNAGSPALQLAQALPQVHVVSTDLSPKSVDLAVKRIAAQKLANATAEPADGQNLKNFDSGSFEAVTCAYGLMHMPDSQLALQEAFRVLKPGGIYLATIWKRDHTQMGQLFQELGRKLLGPNAPQHQFLDTSAEFERQLKAAGFQKVEVSDMRHNFDLELEGLSRFFFDPEGGQLAEMLKKLQAQGKKDIFMEAHQALLNVCSEHGWAKDGQAHFDNTAIMCAAVKA